MTFARFFVANIHNEPFSKLQEEFHLAIQITIGSVIATHYGKYSKLLEGPKDKPMLDNNQIVGITGDARKAEDAGDIRDIGDAGVVGHARNVVEVRHTRHAGDVGDNEAARANNRAADGGDSEDGERGNNEVGDSRDQKDDKVDNDRVSDSGNYEDRKVDNDEVGDSRDQDNQLATVQDAVDRVTDAADPTDKILAEVITYPFGPQSPGSGIPAARTSQSSLPTVLADALIANHFGNKFGAKKFVATITRVFQMVCICSRASSICL